MARKKDELDALREQIKIKDKIIKNLKKEVGRMNKRKSQVDEHLEELAEEHLEELAKEKAVASKETCPDCKGKVDVVDLGMRKIFECTKCEYRQVLKLK